MKQLKIKFKSISCCLLAGLLLMGSPISAFASTPLVRSGNVFFTVENDNLFPLILDNGTIMFFETQEDLDSYQRSVVNGARNIPVYITQEVVLNQDQNFKFINYHPQTPTWTKASSYSITNSKTYSFSTPIKIDTQTFNVSISYSKGVTTTISANSNKFSKLGLYADIVARKVLVTEYEQGTNVKLRQYYSYLTYTTDQYIDVKYQ